MKDLVDIVTYATNESFNLMQLRYAIRSECEKRDMAVPTQFAAPEFWANRYAAYAAKSGAPEMYTSFESASKLASSFFNPALTECAPKDAVWDPEKTEWK